MLRGDRSLASYRRVPRGEVGPRDAAEELAEHGRQLGDGNASSARSTPAAGSTTYGTTCSLRSSSKYVSDLPLHFECCLRSKSVRLAIPISSLQPIGNLYSMSTVRLA